MVCSFTSHQPPATSHKLPAFVLRLSSNPRGPSSTVHRPNATDADESATVAVGWILSFVLLFFCSFTATDADESATVAQRGSAGGWGCWGRVFAGVRERGQNTILHTHQVWSAPRMGAEEEQP